MAMTQAERDKKFRANMREKGYSKICIKFPTAYRRKLELYAERQRKLWENERK